MNTRLEPGRPSPPWRAALLVVAGLLAPGAATAAAGSPTQLALQESVVFGTGHQQPIGVFAAVGLSGCESGTFVDHLNQLNEGGHTLVVDRSYSCNGDTSTFTARMVLHLEPVDANGNQTVVGEWTILDSSGGLSGVHGTGTTSGVSSGCTPIGAQLPMCQTGVSTVTASIQ